MGHSHLEQRSREVQKITYYLQKAIVHDVTAERFLRRARIYDVPQIVNVKFSKNSMIEIRSRMGLQVLKFPLIFDFFRRNTN